MKSVQVPLRHRTIEELLCLELGGKPLASRRGRKLEGPERNRLRVAARFGKRIAFVWEAEPGEELPDAVERRQVRDRVDESAPGALLIFADFLCRREVWQWVDRVAGITILREIVRRPVEDDGGELVARLRIWTTQRRDGTVERERSAAGLRVDGLYDAILSALARTGSAGLPPGRVPVPVDRRSSAAARVLERAVREMREHEIRGFWRALRRLALFDPACAGGLRLAGALRALSALYDAVLERMAAFLTDHEGYGKRPSSRALPDFRRVLESVPSDRVGRESNIAACVIANNLFGMDISTVGVVRARERLSRSVGDDFPGARALLRLNLRAGQVDCGPHPFRRRASGGASLPLVDTHAEELALLDRSVRLMRRIATSGAVLEWENAITRVEKRIESLESALALRAGRANDRRRQSHPRLNLRVAFPGRERAGRFDVVLEKTAQTTTDPESRPYAGRSTTSPRIRAREEAMVYPHEGWGADAAAGYPHHPATKQVLERRSDGYPARVDTAMGAGAPQALHLRGEAPNLAPPLVALFSSARIPPDLVLPAIEVVRAMSFAGSPAVGGFHTPVEKEWLRQLLVAGSRVVLCRARGLGQRRLPRAWEEAIHTGTMTLVSPFDDTMRRPTLQSAAQRNEVVGALATAVFVAHAAPAGMTYQLARSLVDRGVPLFTLDHPSNHDLLRIGAETVRTGEELVSRAVV